MGNSPVGRKESDRTEHLMYLRRTRRCSRLGKFSRPQIVVGVSANRAGVLGDQLPKAQGSPIVHVPRGLSVPLLGHPAYLRVPSQVSTWPPLLCILSRLS